MNTEKVGLGPVEEGKKGSIEEDMIKWYRQPALIQTDLILAVALSYMLMNHRALTSGIASFVADLTGLKVVTLFTFSFITALILFSWFILSTYYTGSISNKIFYAKLFKKTLLFHRGDDNIFHFYIPKINPRDWEVKGIGIFRKKKSAMGWLENGVLMMPTVDGYDEGVDFDEIKNKQLILTDGKVQEDRIRAAKLEAKEEDKKVLSTNALLGFGTIILLISVGAWLMMDKSQSASCQQQLGEISKSLARNVNIENITLVTTTTLKNPLMSIMDTKNKNG